MSIFNPETGQYELMKTGDAYAIPAMSFHGGLNTSDETADILWAIPKHVWTEEFRANPEYDEHYSLFRDPIALNREAVHGYQKHESWAQPGWRPDSAPESYLDDLRCWPPESGSSGARTATGCAGCARRTRRSLCWCASGRASRSRNAGSTCRRCRP